MVKSAYRSMAEELAKLAAPLLNRLAGVINPHTPVGAEAYEIGGLAALAAPSVDDIQARIRTRLAGESGDEAVHGRKVLPEWTHAPIEVGGLGVLGVVPAIHAHHAWKAGH